MVTLFAFVAGIVVGVVHHKWLHPRLKKLWLHIKTQATK